MGRRKKHAAHENHERWLVSYADFITLLFAFFVVMFASSQTNTGKAQQVSDSVRKALEEGQIASAIAGILGGTVDEKGKGNAMLKGPGGSRPKDSPKEPTGLTELLPSLELLSKELRAEIDAGKLRIRMEGRGLVVSLLEAAFFPSGEDTINPKTYGTLQKIADVIGKLPNPVRLEGHTDSVPIHNSRFRSNWELSAARAVAMLDVLNQRYKVPQKRMAIAGYADTAPVDSNQTDEGRARNRRVDLVILNQAGLEVEPSQKPATGSTVEPKPRQAVQKIATPAADSGAQRPGPLPQRGK